MAPERRSEPVGTRLEPSLLARWEAAAKTVGISSSALVYVAIQEHLEAAQRHAVIDEMCVAAKSIEEVGLAVVEATKTAQSRLDRVEALAEKLVGLIETQETRFVTADALLDALNAHGGVEFDGGGMSSDGDGEDLMSPMESSNESK